MVKYTKTKNHAVNVAKKKLRKGYWVQIRDTKEPNRTYRRKYVVEWR